MPRRILPHLVGLSNQMQGIVSHYRRLLDDEFLFGAAVQIPHVATIFDRVGDKNLHFSGEDVSFVELLTLIAYRYGFENVQLVGQGGYALVLGHKERQHLRRVLRLVPEHHVRDIVARTTPPRSFDVRLDGDGEPIRDPDYPLLLSDLFLMPRHTTKLVFWESDDAVMQAGGYPASLHAQLLPEVCAFSSINLDQRMAQRAGDLLEVALATLGVSVADAHGGNGGVLVGEGGRHVVAHDGNGETDYVPVVLDFGYYAQIGARTLARLLIRYGVTDETLRTHVPVPVPAGVATDVDPLAEVIEQGTVPRHTFGRLLYHLPAARLNPSMWIKPAQDHWHTTKEQTYPSLLAQSRLAYLYPDYDEVSFPQRIEAYNFKV